MNEECPLPHLINPRLPLHAALLGLAVAATACAATQRKPGGMPADGLVVSSPKNTLQVQVALRDLGGSADYPTGRRLYYRVERRVAGSLREVLPWSPLGISHTGQSFTDGLVFERESSRSIVEDYQIPHGKRRQYHNEGIEWTLSFRNAKQAALDLELRVFDDGFGFRYRLSGSAPAPVRITEELTGFRVAPDSVATLMPHTAPGYTGINYENLWQVGLPTGAPSPSAEGWSFPALFTSADHATSILITESGLDGSYCATHLAAQSPHGVYRIAFPAPGEALGKGDALPSATLPWTTPWRVLFIGDLATIVQSSLVTDLAPPSRIKNPAFVKPGRASWSWWSPLYGSRDFDKIIPYVELAGEFGWEYTLLDAGWHEMKGGTWQEVVERARARGVGVFLWYNSGGPLNDVLRATPRDRMFDPTIRRAEMKRIVAAGVKGIKVDFFDSDKQDVIKLYLDILADAAAAGLLVNFHGATLPRGWQRTFPNLVGVEAVRGAEGYRFSKTYAEAAPWHNTVQVFTRNVVGGMDYTPVTLSANKYPKTTTDAHELALAVLFEAGVQHFADTPDSYRALPEEARALLAGVPAAWDETHLVEGEPGRHAVLWRRHKRAFYAAGINGTREPVTVALPLTMIGNGTHEMLVIADGKPGQRFTIVRKHRSGMDSFTITMAPNGGFVMRLLPLDPTTGLGREDKNTTRKIGP